MAVVAFVYADWIARYPEFTTSVNSGTATMLFTEAGLFLDNTDGSVVQNIPVRTMLLYMVTAHLAQLNFGSTLGANNPIVGRMDGATEGSVTFTTKYPDQTGLAAWYSQTKYGVAFWAATARYRTFKYRPGPGANTRRYFPW